MYQELWMLRLGLLEAQLAPSGTSLQQPRLFDSKCQKHAGGPEGGPGLAMAL